MIPVPGPAQDPLLEQWLARESSLAARCLEEEYAFAGLKDLDALLELIEVRFAIALRALQDRIPRRELITEMAGGAVRRLEELLGENLSEDQRQAVTEAPGYARVRELFQQFIVQGGGGYLADRAQDARQTRRLARAVVESIRKYTGSLDCFEPIFRTEELPPPLRRLVNFLLPILAPEGQKPPPYGIEEGEEILYSSEKMRLPLSQAIHYLENQLLPALERELAAEPGDRALQQRLQAERERFEAYRRLRFAPRSTPINIEQGFYTEWWSEFTAEGELLVSVPLAVQYRSGTNLDRLQNLVLAELVRRLAGRGVSPALDREYRYRKSLESGRHGSSRLPGFRLNTRRGFLELKGMFPVLQRLENRREFAALVEEVRGRGRLAAQKAVEKLLASPAVSTPQLP